MNIANVTNMLSKTDRMRADQARWRTARSAFRISVLISRLFRSNELQGYCVMTIENVPQTKLPCDRLCMSNAI